MTYRENAKRTRGPKIIISQSIEIEWDNVRLSAGISANVTADGEGYGIASYSVGVKIDFARFNFGEIVNTQVRLLDSGSLALLNDMRGLDTYDFFNRSPPNPASSFDASSQLVNDHHPSDEKCRWTLATARSFAFTDIAKYLAEVWDRAFDIPPVKWEEIIAAAINKEGFNEVILTPRSGDHGRDVIAIRHGIASAKILVSVKAYSRGNTVRHDDVRALMGVVDADQNTSKGILATTSDFAPRILSDPYISKNVSTRIELLNGESLRKWLRTLYKLDERLRSCIA